MKDPRALATGAFSVPFTDTVRTQVNDTLSLVDPDNFAGQYPIIALHFFGIISEPPVGEDAA